MTQDLRRADRTEITPAQLSAGKKALTEALCGFGVYDVAEDVVRAVHSAIQQAVSETP